MSDIVRQSKRVAHRLRHTELIDKCGGWVRCSVLMQLLGLTQEELTDIVVSDAKGRFQFSDDSLSIRALYGHSVEVDMGYEPAIPPMLLYHGTAERSLEAISCEGLKSKSRNFVHLCESVEMATSVGERHGEPYILEIDTRAMVRDGYKFFNPKHDVWLTECVPSEYILNCRPNK